jgi:hypothetical protein
MLVGSLFGEKIILLSELAKWYLEKGLVITKIYQMVDYIPRAIYAEFASSVSAARRLGDADPDMSLLANTSKLIGNSAYGKTITNKERHRNVRYVDGDEDASVKIRGVNFDSLTEIDSKYYEIILRKAKVRCTFLNTLYTFHLGTVSDFSSRSRFRNDAASLFATLDRLPIVSSFRCAL